MQKKTGGVWSCREGDKLKLPSGQLIDYDKPYILCKQELYTRTGKLEFMAG